MRTRLEINQVLQTPHKRFRHGVIKDIAERAEVSEQTVQNVLRMLADVTPSTKLKVIQAADAVAQRLEEHLKELKRYESN